MSTYLFKQICELIIIPLAILINQYIFEGSMPEALKIAEVQLIYKSNSKQNLNKYRPVLVLPSISKIFERSFSKSLYFLMSICYSTIDNVVFGQIIQTLMQSYILLNLHFKHLKRRIWYWAIPGPVQGF